MQKIVIGLLLGAVVIGAGWYMFNAIATERDLGETGSVAPAESATEAASLAGTQWQWEETLYNNDVVVAPDTPEAFVLTLEADGQFSATTDCNNLMGQYEVDAETNAFSFDQIAATRMACPDGSQEMEFTQMLEETQGFVITDEGKLALTIRYDSGSVIFAPVTVSDNGADVSDQESHQEIIGNHGGEYHYGRGETRHRRTKRSI